LPWQPNFGQNRQKNHKNGHNFSCMQHIHAEFGFEIGFVTSGNSSMTLTYTRDKGALPWQPILVETFNTRYASRDTFEVSRSTRPEVEIWRTFSLSNAKINRKRPQIAEISCPINKEIGVKESNGDVRILTRSS